MIITLLEKPEAELHVHNLEMGLSLQTKEGKEVYIDVRGILFTTSRGENLILDEWLKELDACHASILP